MDADRIGRALARIEAAAERIASTAGGAENRPSGDEELARRHEKLRREAGAALAELDQLILALEQ